MGKALCKSEFKEFSIFFPERGEKRSQVGTQRNFDLFFRSMEKNEVKSEFKENLKTTTKSIEQLSDNLNTIMGNGNAEAFAEDLKVISHNVNEISTYVNSLTKDDQLKKDLTNTVANINKAMSDISTSLAAVNKLGPDQRTELEKIIENTEVTTCNLRKFSEKLNKRFLLFRLMF